MKSICFFSFLLFAAQTIFAETYYLDPDDGDIANTGSISAPWGRLQDVIEAGMIEQLSYSPLPYDPVVSEITLKNPGIVKSGDTLFLYGGLHGEIFLRNYNNSSKIYIIGLPDEQPIIEKIKIQTGKHWHFENLIISSEPYDYYINDRLFFIETHGFHGPSSHVDVINCEMYSSINPWETEEGWLNNVSSGLYIFADSVRAIGNTIQNIDHAITAKGDYIDVVDNFVNNFSGDGIRVLGSYGSYRKNTIMNCYNVDDNHDDGIQSFTTGGLVVDNNELIGNIIINTDDFSRPLNGPLQGIGCFDGIYHNWEVINNVVFVNHWHGITLLGADSCKIINNTVIDPTPDETPGASWIRIADDKDGTPSTNCIVANNVANKFVIDAQDINNVELVTYEDYANNFVDFLTGDFHLVETSQLINNASLEYSPEEDADGILRLSDNLADIGAYEYLVPVNLEESKKEEYIIYPNPFTDLIHIEGDGILSISILSITGDLLIKSDTSQINSFLSQLSQGTYIVHIYTSEGDNHFELLIKR